MAPADVNGCNTRQSIYKNVILYTTDLISAVEELGEHSAAMISYWGNQQSALVYITMPDIEVNFRNCRPIPDIDTDSNHVVGDFLKSVGIFDIPLIGYVKKNANDITGSITKGHSVASNLRALACSTDAQLAAMTHLQ